MQRLRHASFLARLVLAWFALAIGAAVAAPLVQPAGVELVCSGGGMKLLVEGSEGRAGAAHTLDCPLCAALDAPPSDRRAAQPARHPVRLPQAIECGPACVSSAAPPPGRGPPPAVLSS